MIVVVHGDADSAAEELVDEWGPSCVGLTPSDLSRAGWALSFPPSRDDTFVARGEIWPVSSVTGVLVRIDAVRARDLSGFDPDDRVYAAAEMHALLVYWLSSLGARVVNRPSPLPLLGPAWTHEQWLRAGRRLDAPCGDVVLGEDGPGVERPRTRAVTVVGDRAFGAPPGVERWATALAHRAECRLVEFELAELGGTPHLIGVNLRPLLDDPEIRGALHDEVQRRGWP